MTSYLTAKLVGEGYARPDADRDLPIDINYAKLSEWLVDRKQVPGDWNRKLQAIQAKAAEAARELPPGFLAQLEDATEDAAPDYFLAQRVLAKLGETAEKGLLGGYKGAAGDWEKIVKAYEYNFLHVAEAAQTLCRNADYEIPYLKKQAAKGQQQLADLEKRAAEARRSAAAAVSEYQQECAALGIDSAGDVKAGLLGLTAELPELAGAAVEALQAPDLTAAIQYYAGVVGEQRQQQGAAGEAGDAQAAAKAAAGPPADLLQVLREVREGRTEPPPAAEASTDASGAPAAAAAHSDGGTAAEEGDVSVEWDLGAALEAAGGTDAAVEEAGTAGGISWDIEVEPAGGEGAENVGDVDASADADAAGDDLMPAAPAEPAEISWEIDLAGGGEEAQQAAQQQASAAAGAATQQGAQGGGSAAAPAFERAPAAVRRLVEDGAFRVRLLDDLFELRAFLMQRRRELSGRGGELLLAAAAGGGAGAHVGADQAGDMLAAVETALGQLQGERLKQLTALRASGRHLDRVAAGLRQKAGQEGKFLRAAADAEARRREVQRQLVADSAKLAALVSATRRAKEGAEAALSAKLGRRINVQGDVNQLL